MMGTVGNAAGEPLDRPGQVTVRHEAMATEFRVTIVDADTRYARQAASEAFALLDRLDERLNRYYFASDVSRIRALLAGESAVVDPDTWECLRIALDAERWTGGAFNIAYACRPRRWANDAIRLDGRRPLVTVATADTGLDLGGIGKGFALDCMAATLVDWELDRYLLCASASTFLAGGPPLDANGWLLRFGPAGSRCTRLLRHAAWSGSGTAVRGEHIVDPTTGAAARRHEMAWAGAPTAAEADSLSTALMVMTPQAAKQLCQQRPDVSAYVLPAGQSVVQGLHLPPEE